MDERDMQHGQDWCGQDLSGWHMSEKMDGARAYWDGATLWSRGGIACKIPAHWRQTLPAIALDCELYDGIDGRYRCGAAIKTGKVTPSMRLVVFDAPTFAGDWPGRMQAARAACAGSDLLVVLPWRVCASTADALAELSKVQARGGEGLMLRRRGLAYRPGRTADMVKVKESTPNCC